jgi:hypothetical protein
MREEQLNPTESLNVIHSMINTAKNKLADDGFLLILWGWLIIAAAMLHYVSIISDFESGHIVWAVAVPVGVLVSIVYGLRQRKKELHKTYIDTYLGYVWSGFIIAMFITLSFMGVHTMKTSYFFLMILYGLATFISGGLLNFKPLIFGSIFSFICAIVSVFAGEKEQLLCISLALLLSYVIPGHMLRAKYKSQTNV